MYAKLVKIMVVLALLASIIACKGSGGDDFTGFVDGSSYEEYMDENLAK